MVSDGGTCWLLVTRADPAGAAAADDDADGTAATAGADVLACDSTSFATALAADDFAAASAVFGPRAPGDVCTERKSYDRSNV